MMKLIERYQITSNIKSSYPYYCEIWDLGGGYEIDVNFDSPELCTFDIIKINHGSITYEISPYLGVDTDLNKLIWPDESQELYLTTGIDCAVLYYRKPAQYKELLEKIENIINQHFKGK